MNRIHSLKKLEKITKDDKNVIFIDKIVGTKNIKLNVGFSAHTPPFRPQRETEPVDRYPSFVVQQPKKKSSQRARRVSLSLQLLASLATVCHGCHYYPYIMLCKAKRSHRSRSRCTAFGAACGVWRFVCAFSPFKHKYHLLFFLVNNDN